MSIDKGSTTWRAVEEYANKRIAECTERLVNRPIARLPELDTETRARIDELKTLMETLRK